MNQKRFIRLIITPSTGLSFLIVGIALLIQVVSSFLFLSNSGVIYEYLFGEGSSVTLIESSKSIVSTFNEQTLGNSALNKVLFFAFWMAIGLIAYLVVNSLRAGVDTAEDVAQQSNYVHANQSSIKADLRGKLVLRIIAICLSIIYVTVFVSMLLPFAIYTARILATEPSIVSNWLLAFLGLLELSVSLFIGVVLIRFCLLKPRVFGGTEDIIEDELSH